MNLGSYEGGLVSCALLLGLACLMKNECRPVDVTLSNGSISYRESKTFSLSQAQG